MVRPKKYQRKTESLCLSLDPAILEVIKKRAEYHRKSTSEFVSDILKNFANNDYQYAEMMAKEHARKMYFWKAEKERLKEGN